MCGRYYLTTPGDVVARVFDALPPPFGPAPPRYNVAPSQQVLVARARSRDERGSGGPPNVLCMMRWGLIPSWAREPDIGNRTINARSETADTLPAFRASFRRRRCLIPADGFFEWRVQPDAGKQPICVRVSPGKGAAPGLLAMAGLWDTWDRPGEGGTDEPKPIESCTILTTAASDFVAKFHDRMPVILRPEDYAGWLGEIEGEPLAGDLARLKALCRPYPSELTIAYAVSKRVSSPRNDDPRCLEPAETAGEPGLF